MKFSFLCRILLASISLLLLTTNTFSIGDDDGAPAPPILPQNYHFQDSGLLIHVIENGGCIPGFSLSQSRASAWHALTRKHNRHDPTNPNHALNFNPEEAYKATLGLGRLAVYCSQDIRPGNNTMDTYNALFEKLSRTIENTQNTRIKRHAIIWYARLYTDHNQRPEYYLDLEPHSFEEHVWSLLDSARGSNCTKVLPLLQLKLLVDKDYCPDPNTEDHRRQLGEELLVNLEPDHRYHQQFQQLGGRPRPAPLAVPDPEQPARAGTQRTIAGISDTISTAALKAELGGLRRRFLNKYHGQEEEPNMPQGFGQGGNPSDDDQDDQGPDQPLPPSPAPTEQEEAHMDPPDEQEEDPRPSTGTSSPNPQRVLEEQDDKYGDEMDLSTDGQDAPQPSSPKAQEPTTAKTNPVNDDKIAKTSESDDDIPLARLPRKKASVAQPDENENSEESDEGSPIAGKKRPAPKAKQKYAAADSASEEERSSSDASDDDSDEESVTSPQKRRKAPPLTDNQKKQLRQKLEADRNYDRQKLAKEVGCTRPQITAFCQKNSFTRTRKQAVPNLTAEQEKIIIELLKENPKRNKINLAEEAGCTPKQVSNLAVREKLTTRKHMPKVKVARVVNYIRSLSADDFSMKKVQEYFPDLNLTETKISDYMKTHNLWKYTIKKEGKVVDTEKVISLHKKGTPFKTIAEQCKCTVDTVREKLRAAGLYESNRLPKDTLDAMHAYVEQNRLNNVTTEGLMKKFKIDRERASQFLKRCRNRAQKS